MYNLNIKVQHQLTTDCPLLFFIFSIFGVKLLKHLLYRNIFHFYCNIIYCVQVKFLMIQKQLINNEVMMMLEEKNKTQNSETHKIWDTGVRLKKRSTQ